MKRLLLASLVLAWVAPLSADEPAKTEPAKAKVVVGEKAPEFKIKDTSGKEISLADLTAKGPVLVRLTCGCAGCDKELTYFQEIDKEYKDKGLVTLFVFKEPDDKVAKYVKEKKLNALYAVDSKGAAWDTFQTKTMPTNFLIDRGGKIVAIAAGCDPSGLLAKKLSEKVTKVVEKPEK
jgi:peroxiredoxin